VPNHTSRRWLIVVQPDQRELYERLRESLRPDAPFEVILERRKGERRGAGRGPSPGPERRQRERRQRTAIGLFYVAGSPQAENGARPILPPAAAAIRPGPEVVTVACPSCLAMLNFELPRFPRPPARLEAEVVHVAGPGAVQHFAEIQAFTLTGRPLLVGRVQAVRHRPGGSASPAG
jgi:hypothetical protein